MTFPNLGIPVERFNADGSRTVVGWTDTMTDDALPEREVGVEFHLNVKHYFEQDEDEDKS